MAVIEVKPNSRVKTVRDAFRGAYGIELRVYRDNNRFADDEDTLGSIKMAKVAGGELSFNANFKVKNLERKFLEELGIIVQIEDKDGKLADDELTLGDVLRA
jgi:hypothetical protein